LCTSDDWVSDDPTKCASDAVGIEINTDRFHPCHQIRWLIDIDEEEYVKLARIVVKYKENLIKSFVY